MSTDDVKLTLDDAILFTGIRNVKVIVGLGSYPITVPAMFQKL